MKDSVTGRQKEKTLILDAVPESEQDIYVSTTAQTRLDMLAEEYYNDASLWWVIARANSLTSLIVKDGKVIRIPSNPKVTYVKE